VRRACEMLKLKAPTHGTFNVFNNQLEGLGIFLPNWQYAIVVDLKSGEVNLDDYNGRWGSREEFDKFLTRYTLEAAKQAAEDDGKTYSPEYTDEQGRLCIDVDLEPVGQHVHLGGATENEGDAGFAL
jgi:hypothetical protein